MEQPVRVPMLDLQAEIEQLWDEVSEAIAGVLRSGRFVLGPNVQAFEREAAAYLGAEHAVGVNSGTDALVIGLRAAGVDPGDEVVTTPFTFFATAEAISAIGAVPIFADVDAGTLNISPESAASVLSDRTRAIVPVHLFGRPAAMDDLARLVEGQDIVIVEDVAQAFGAEVSGRKLGTLGTVGAFSFFPSKNLGAYGDGGLIATSDDRVAELARMLRQHGGRDKYANEMIGYNSRLDELQAAILRCKLPGLDDRNKGRRLVAARYGELLDGIQGLVVPDDDGGRHVFHQYTVRVPGERRDVVRERLAANRIDSAVYYARPLHVLPMYASNALRLPNAERAAEEVLSLPIWPGMLDETVERVASVVRDALT